MMSPIAIEFESEMLASKWQTVVDRTSGNVLEMKPHELMPFVQFEWLIDEQIKGDAVAAAQSKKNEMLARLQNSKSTAGKRKRTTTVDQAMADTMASLKRHG